MIKQNETPRLALAVKRDFFTTILQIWSLGLLRYILKVQFIICTSDKIFNKTYIYIFRMYRRRI